jgi:hypothetical protein
MYLANSPVCWQRARRSKFAGLSGPMNGYATRQLDASRHSTRLGRGDQASGHPRPAVPNAPFRASPLHMLPAAFAEVVGVLAGLPQVGDGQTATGAQHPHRLTEAWRPPPWSGML